MSQADLQDSDLSYFWSFVCLLQVCPTELCYNTGASPNTQSQRMVTTVLQSGLVWVWFELFHISSAVRHPSFQSWQSRSVNSVLNLSVLEGTFSETVTWRNVKFWRTANINKINIFCWDRPTWAWQPAHAHVGTWFKNLVCCWFSPRILYMFPMLTKWIRIQSWSWSARLLSPPSGSDNKGGLLAVVA